MTVLDKLIKEYRELDVKILRLKRFLENGVAPTEAEGVMMETQLSAMTLYKKDARNANRKNQKNS